MSNRVGRSVADEVFSSGRKPRFRYSLLIADKSERLEVRYKRSAWHRISDGGEVKQRSIEGQIFADANHAGSFELVEFDVAPLTSGHQFLDEMDGYSQAAAHLAETIVQHWEDPSDLFDYGNVIEIRRLWMEPRLSGNRRLARSIDAILEQEFGRRSLAILKAFPLEYEGKVDDVTQGAFRRRQRAMMRLYGRMFGLIPLPGSSGDDGWMYAIPDRLKKCDLEPTEVDDWVSIDDDD